MLSIDFGGPMTLRLLDTNSFTQADLVSFQDLGLEDTVDLVTTDGHALAFCGGGGFDEPTHWFVLTNPFEE
jgi:hypothetical protein